MREERKKIKILSVSLLSILLCGFGNGKSRKIELSLNQSLLTAADSNQIDTTQKAKKQIEFVINRDTLNMIREKIKKIKRIPLYSRRIEEDTMYWHIVKMKLAVVPYLIELIKDTTKFNTKHFYMMYIFKQSGNKVPKYKLGDVALDIVTNIVGTIPISYFSREIIRLKGDTVKPYNNYHSILASSNKYRITLSGIIKKWYEKNYTLLTWRNNDTYDNGLNSGIHPAGGFYYVRLKEQVPIDYIDVK